MSAWKRLRRVTLSAYDTWNAGVSPAFLVRSWCPIPGFFGFEEAPSLFAEGRIGVTLTARLFRAPAKGHSSKVMKRILSKLIFCALVLWCGVAFAQMQNAGPAEKDMESVHRIYLAPPTSDDPQNPAFWALVKGELVHNGFSVPDKAEGADATLTIEIVSGQEKGKQATLEVHCLLDAGPDNTANWHLTRTKSGQDMDKLLADAARAIGGGLHTYRFDTMNKKDQKEKKN